MIFIPFMLATAFVSGVSYEYELLYDNTAVITAVTIPYGITDIQIPETIDGYTVSGIEQFSFAGQVSAERVTIPNSVNYIGDSAFMSCTSLREVVIGKGVKSLPDDCFFACPALETITLPDSLEKIGNETFFGCSALDLYIPQNVYSIGDNAFGMTTDPHSNEYVNIYDFLVRGVSGSYAEYYSQEHNIDFIDMNNYTAGDINNDSLIDATDASAVLAEYARASTGTSLTFTKKQNIIGDIDMNGIIDASDASKILEIYSELSTNS